MDIQTETSKTQKLVILQLISTHRTSNRVQANETTAPYSDDFHTKALKNGKTTLFVGIVGSSMNVQVKKKNKKTQRFLNEKINIAKEHIKDAQIIMSCSRVYIMTCWRVNPSRQ